MTRGRKPKPREVQVAEGRHLKNPKRFENEIPDRSEHEPVKPDHITGFAAEEWERVEQLMRAANLWSASYQVTIEIYCETYSNYRLALERVNQTGQAIVQSDKAGKPVVTRNPFSVELHKYKEEVLRLLTELGLTPSSRARVQMPKEDGGDDTFLSILAG